MDDSIYNFWRTEGINNIQPRGTPVLHEGWSILDFLKELRTPEEYGSVIDIGCGYGRLCKAFNPSKYTGLDFNKDAIEKAKRENPEYSFTLLDKDSKYYHSNTKLLFYVLLHQCDEDLDEIVYNLCKTSDKIIIAEICGREWRRKGNPPVFNRNVEEYINIFSDYDKESVQIINKPYIPYKTKYNDRNTNLSIMVFE
jgi:SAM-dependent methyltransferase